MAATEQNFEMYAGDTKNINIEVRQDGEIINVSQATFKWAMKNSPTVKENVLYKESGEGIITTDGENGLIRIRLDSSDTEDLIGGFYHEVEMTDHLGNISTITVGNAVILPSGVGAGSGE